MANEYEGESQYPSIITEIWENWRKPGGEGPCKNCPQHWSRRIDIPNEGFDGEPHSYGQHPWYGEGDLDPEVIIVGEEPGWHVPYPNDNKINDEFTQSRPDIRDVAEGTDSISNIQPFLEHLFDKNIHIYWTEMSKCNALPYKAKQKEKTMDKLQKFVKREDIPSEAIREDLSEPEMLKLINEQNENAQDVCCGLNGNNGYLSRELETLDPEVVVPLGLDCSKKLLDLYGLSNPWSTFTSSITSGDTISGQVCIQGHEAPFEIIPALHPGQGFTHADNDLREACKYAQDADGEKKSYYQQFAKDLEKHLPSV